jgi:hypothetical protein
MMTSRTSVLAPVYSSRDINVFTSRVTSTSLLCIDSEDRFRDYDESRSNTAANRNPYDYTINKSAALLNGFFTRLGVTEVVFPWVIPNINRFTYLINIQYDIGAGPVNDVIELDEGFYLPSQIASTVQAKVRALAPAPGDLGSFTMTYGVQTIGLTTTVQRPIFEYGVGAIGVTVAFSPIGATGVFTDRRRKQLFDILGFTAANEILAPSGDGGDTYCQSTRYVDIVCSQLTNNQALKDSMSQVVARDVLARVYLGDAAGVQSTVLPSSATFCPPGCMPTTIYKNYSQPKQIQWMPNQPVPGSLRFEVFDDAGSSLADYVLGASGDGANWSLSILVTEN